MERAGVCGVKIDKLIAEASELPWNQADNEVIWFEDEHETKAVARCGDMISDPEDFANAALIAHLSKVALLYREMVDAATRVLDNAHGLPASACVPLADALARIQELEQ